MTIVSNRNEHRKSNTFVERLQSSACHFSRNQSARNTYFFTWPKKYRYYFVSDVGLYFSNKRSRKLCFQPNNYLVFKFHLQVKVTQTFPNHRLGSSSVQLIQLDWQLHVIDGSASILGSRALHITPYDWRPARQRDYFKVYIS